MDNELLGVNGDTLIALVSLLSSLSVIVCLSLSYHDKVSTNALHYLLYRRVPHGIAAWGQSLFFIFSLFNAIPENSSKGSAEKAATSLVLSVFPLALTLLAPVFADFVMGFVFCISLFHLIWMLPNSNSIAVQPSDLFLQLYLSFLFGLLVLYLGDIAAELERRILLLQDRHPSKDGYDSILDGDSPPSERDLCLSKSARHVAKLIVNYLWSFAAAFVISQTLNCLSGSPFCYLRSFFLPMQPNELAYLISIFLLSLAIFSVSLLPFAKMVECCFERRRAQKIVKIVEPPNYVSKANITTRFWICLTIFSGSVWIIYIFLVGKDGSFSSIFSGFSFVIFFFAEVLNFVLSIVFFANFWCIGKRKRLSLNKAKDKNEMEGGWNPQVSCSICHYTEDVSDTMKTLRACLQMDHSSEHVRQVVIADDGFFKVNREPRQQKDLSPLSVDIMIESLESSPLPGEEEAERNGEWTVTDAEEIDATVEKVEQFINNVYAPRFHAITRDNDGRTMIKIVAVELMEFVRPLTKIKTDESPWMKISVIHHTDLVRKDCAISTIVVSFETELNQVVRIVGREKPPKFHAKAGNLNNYIYNSHMDEEINLLAFFDNDMAPKAKFLDASLSWFFDSEGDFDTGVGFLQTPQCFHNVVVEENDWDDILAARNSIFFFAIQSGRDGFESCAFAGTNAIFSRKALLAVHGVPYGSMTEDALLGKKLHDAGLRSVYLDEVLVVGNAPETVAMALIQRMRWIKGSVEILMGALNIIKPYPIEKSVETIANIAANELELQKWSEKVDGKQKLFRIMFSLDTMFYVFSAASSLIYIFNSLIYLYTSYPPVQINDDFTVFIIIFSLYFVFRNAVTRSAYEDISSIDVWRSQQSWFSFGISALIGIINAFQERVTGKGIAWVSTGSSQRFHLMEVFNLFLVLSLIIGMIYRGLMLLLNENSSCLTDITALFFGGIVLIQLWPMVSTSLFVWFHGPKAPLDKITYNYWSLPPTISFFMATIVGLLVAIASYNHCISPR